jgi:glycosyltransferase involved in cell wall biosynthesis
MSSPSVSVIIPARDEEANIARAVESLSAQNEVAEIIVIDDQSKDRTASILAELTLHLPRLRLLETGDLPKGWMGKNYAVSLGAAAARGEWLLFTDADTVHLQGSTARALADAQEHQAALVSYSPEQETRTFWERVLIPFIYCRLAEKFCFARVNDPASRDAAANGQYLLIHREAYEAIDGHRSVAGEVLEDVALARRVKQAGYRIYFAPGRGIARTRMYRSFGGMWQGWTKNLYPLMGGCGRAMARELFVVFPWLAILSIAAGAIEFAHPAGRVLLIFGLLLLAGRHAAYAAELSRNPYPRKFILYYVPAVLLYSCALIVSAWKNTRGIVAWKGREYPAQARPQR